MAAVAIACLSLPSTPAFAAGNQSAKGVLGQASYTNYSSQSAGSSGISAPFDTAVDPTDRRIFIADYSYNRVQMFQIGSDGMPLDSTQDAVLGQSNTSNTSAATTQAGLNHPDGVAYDDVNNRLYVADSGNNRVLVYNAGTGSLATGMNAAYVIGQSNFTTGTAGSGATGLSSPSELAIDPTGNRLFVTDQSHNRVLVFNVSALNDGLTAVNVLGQADMSANVTTRNQSTLSGPSGIAYDAIANRLFVSDTGHARVMVWDVGSITDGMNASNVIGKADFIDTSGVTSQSNVTAPHGIELDAGSRRLYVTDSVSRILRFNVSSVSNGMNAEEVYGQVDFVSNAFPRGQNGFWNPYGLGIDPITQTLYISDMSASREMIYDGFAATNTTTVQIEVLPSLTFVVAGYNSGTCNGATITDTLSTPTAVNLHPAPGGNAIAGQTLTVSSNSNNGYSLYTRYTGVLTGNSKTIVDISSDNATPAAFPASGTAGFGYTTDHTLSGTSTRFQSNKWAKFTTANDQIAYATGPPSSDVTHLCVQVGTSTSTAAGTYQTTLIHTVVPSF
jgi:DNA-binding beta-propeller fold protein YncE